MSNVVEFPGQQRSVNGGGGGVQDLDGRLRAVEGDVREIKVRTEDVAKKSDIRNLASEIKTWILGGVAMASLVIIGWLVGWVVRLTTGQP